MIKTFNLIQKDNNSFENKLTVQIYQGETIDFNFVELDFTYEKANVKVNNIFVGTISNNQIGIHSSKLKSGLNEISVDFLNNSNEIIKNLKYKFIVNPTRGAKSLEEEFNTLFSELELLKDRVSEIENWKQEIDNERSGF